MHEQHFHAVLNSSKVLSAIFNWSAYLKTGKWRCWSAVPPPWKYCWIKKIIRRSSLSIRWKVFYLMVNLAFPEENLLWALQTTWTPPLCHTSPREVQSWASELFGTLSNPKSLKNCFLKVGHNLVEDIRLSTYFLFSWFGFIHLWGVGLIWFGWFVFYLSSIWPNSSPCTLCQ